MKNIQVVQTAKDTGDRLTPKQELTLMSGVMEAPHSVRIDASQCFQTIEGFGGAFTQSAAVTLYELPVEKQTEVLRAYFDPNLGHGYTLCRTHINSCDFSSGNYTYDEVPNDYELQYFSIDCDRRALANDSRRIPNRRRPDQAFSHSLESTCLDENQRENDARRQT
jgi:glucosylceramidase